MQISKIIPSYKIIGFIGVPFLLLTGCGVMPVEPIAAKGTEKSAVASRPSLPKAITDQKGVKMALVPAGEFLMGSELWHNDEKPAHTVYLEAFYLDVFEATNARYAACVAAGACQLPTNTESNRQRSYYGDAKYDNYPVVYVTWAMAKSYCEWRGGGLPTEAQWEKAARGGLQGLDYPWGSELPICKTGLINGANIDECSDDDTHAVGSYSPNGYGLYDMGGNVWEWTSDLYEEDYYRVSPERNPSGPADGFYRVMRGGGWNLGGSHLRVSNRDLMNPASNNYSTGVRCAAEARGGS